MSDFRIRSREEEVLDDLIAQLRELKKAQKQPRKTHSAYLIRGIEIAEALLVRERARWRAGCAACGGSGLAPNGEDACVTCKGTGRPIAGGA